MSKLQPVRGTHDLLPDEFAKFFAIQQTAREITARYGFKEMATPMFWGLNEPGMQAKQEATGFKKFLLKAL